MTISMKKHAGLLGLAIAGALSLAANTAWASTNYKFKQADCLSGDTVKVRLVDETTGKSVANAQVFAVRRLWLPGKGEPRFIERKIALTPDGEGRFTYEGSEAEPGANIKLVAQLDGADISGSTTIC
ncbi:MAG TPA: hypothetical protein VG501_02675 [Rhizomicrobium sp.]|nr:hypothetical protein [Rhizomicrobium sp.]